MVATGGAGQCFAVTTNPAAVDRRRHRHGPARRRRGRRRRVHAVPPDRAPSPVDAPTAAVRGPAGRGCGAARRGRAWRSWPTSTRSAISRRATSSPGRSRGGSSEQGTRPPVARRHRDRRLRGALPDDLARLPARSASIPTATGSRSRPPPTTSAAASAPTSTARRSCPGCGRAAKPRARACTARTGSRRTRSSTGSCSARRTIDAIARGQGRARRERRAARRRAVRARRRSGARGLTRPSHERSCSGS